MKKFLSIILLTAAISLPSQAQIKFGAKAGVNLTNMSFSESVGDKSNRAGFFVGPTVLINLPIVGLGIDASALYDQREAKGQGQTIKAQQIAIPINVRYGVGLGTMASIFAYAGPQFGFNVGSKEKNLATGVDWKLASSNFSINMGVGVMALNHLQVTAGYNMVCGKTGEISVNNGVKTIRGRDHAWQIAATYYF